MDLLACTIMPYSWGSRTAIAELTGRPTPSVGPEAELWMGAHPVAPSRVHRDGGEEASLEEIISRDPERELGTSVVRELGPRLPFLLKVLAAAEPLSLQAHPTSEQARTGWDDEEKRGVARNAPTRNYKDASHKPELLCALTPFVALSGFRAIGDTLRLFDTLDVPELEPLLRPLRASPDPRGLGETFRALMTMPASDRAAVVDATVAACNRHDDDNNDNAFTHERAWAVRLEALYPGDIGVVSALLLELVHLSPGDAIYLGAGNLHAYLEGTGVEIMASSDNVLRGGLTKKHVDVPELLRVLDFGGGPARIVRPRAIDAHESVYDTPAREFRLSRLTINPNSGLVVRRGGEDGDGPEILLATEGAAAIYCASSENARDHLTMTRGSAVFIPAGTKSYTLRSDAPATVYRATTNLR